KSPWIFNLKFKPNPQLRLFCFPYAGGNALIYRSWEKTLPKEVECCPVQLPGRGSRLTEKPFTQLLPLVQAICEGILPYLDRSFAFFGHSMGALISFELMRILRRDYKCEPVHLFVSGRRAPHFKDTEPYKFNLPKEEFIAELRRLKGTPQEVLDHPELMELLIPLLRADFEVCQTYNYTTEPPYNCPITVFGGNQDSDVNKEHLEGWRNFTTRQFSLNIFDGDHFFIHSMESLMLNIISRQIQIIVNSPA
ncbi:MAG: thioesterase II family protein, partial [Acidobacteriota bacterium]